jgi:hypothetical protein
MIGTAIHITTPGAPRAAYEHLDLDDPDQGYGSCCMGAAMQGVDYCTCWEPVFDLEQDQALQEGPMEQLTKCCHDCAFRQGSPERDRDGALPYSIEVTVDEGRGFMCHQGMRRTIAWRHPDGREVPAGDGDYQPPQVKGPPGAGRAWRADGRPGQLCGGYGAHRRGR